MKAKVKYPIIYYNNPILNTPCKEVTVFDENLKQFCDELKEHMLVYDGIGLAANQIGVDKRVVTIGKIEDIQDTQCYINPKIIAFSEDFSLCEEGCLSFPKLYLSIERPAEVTIQYQDENGTEQTLKAYGILARALQHEIDHINGITFIKRIPFDKLQSVLETLSFIDRTYNG